jgi:hypothetical protein
LVVRENLSHLSPEDFWAKMREKNWVWLEDEAGHPVTADVLEKMRVWDLADDPYRSLAWVVRQMGGFQKTAIPFAEFFWGKRFRELGIQVGKTPEEFARAVREAYQISRSEKFADLPGFIGKIWKKEAQDTFNRMVCDGLFGKFE